MYGGKIHMMDAFTKEITDIPIRKEEEPNQEGLFVSLTEKNGSVKDVHLNKILQPDFYETVHNSVFDGKGSTFAVHQKDAQIDLNNLVKIAIYDKWVQREVDFVDKVEDQKELTFSEKEVELYKEIKKEGYEPIEAIEKQITGFENEKSIERTAHLITIEALPDSKDEEVGRIHMMNAETKEIYDLTIWNLDKSNRDDLYINPMEKNGERDELYLDSMLEHELYKKVQSAIFENKGDQSFVVHQKNAIINLEQLVKDERYGSIVDKVEFQKNPILSAKDVELYKEMKKEGYAPIKLIDEKIKTAEREVKNAYENYKYAHINETPESKQSIQKRSFAEEKYFETKIAAINDGFMEQVEVMKIEKSVDNKVDQLVYGKGRNNSETKELSDRILISKTEYNEPIGISVRPSGGKISDKQDKLKRNPVNRGRRKNEEEMAR